MAPRTTLKTETLVALGPEKLAKLILDEASHNAPFKRSVTAAVAGSKGPDAVAAIIDRRLSSLERARGYIDYDKRRAFAADLASVLSTIVDELGSADAGAAIQRLLRFLRTASGVLERVDDSGGSIQRLFEDAASGLPPLVASMSDGDRGRLIPLLVPAALDDASGFIGMGVLDVVPTLRPGERKLLDEAAQKARSRALAERSGDWHQRIRTQWLVQLRQAVSDADGDVDGFIALEEAKGEERCDAVAVAERLLAAGRAREALTWVRKPSRHQLCYASRESLADRDFGFDLFEHERQRLEIVILDAAGERDEAQRNRLDIFQTRLDAQMLRDHVARLPDFEDEEALDRAFAHAATHPQRHGALAFFLQWPRLDLAAKLVLDRAGEWDGKSYEVLAPAAEALEGDHPVAATVLYRVLVDDILARGRSNAYGHGARDLGRLAAIAAALPGSGLKDHEAYVAELRRSHGRKYGFWSLVGGRKQP